MMSNRLCKSVGCTLLCTASDVTFVCLLCHLKPTQLSVTCCLSVPSLTCFCTSLPILLFFCSSNTDLGLKPDFSLADFSVPALPVSCLPRLSDFALALISTFASRLPFSCRYSSLCTYLDFASNTSTCYQFKIPVIALHLLPCSCMEH